VGPSGTDIEGAVRLLDPRGNWYVSAASNPAAEAAMNASGASSTETDDAYLDSLVPSGARVAKHKGHAHIVHVAKKGHGLEKSHK
jgi:hypothetical protein